jgi:DNA mismatch endonuclease (patch repair protein)
VVFVDGDFWHGNPRSFKVPVTNSVFWREKIRYNRAKDRRVARLLRARGWTVIRIWESALRKRPGWCVARVVRAVEKRLL